MMPLFTWATGQLMLDVVIATELASAGGTTDVVRAEPRMTTPIQVVRGENAPGVLLRR
jgi:hypothetical protein